MSLADDQLLDPVATVYDAALEPERWPEVAAEAGRGCPFGPDHAGGGGPIGPPVD